MGSPKQVLDAIIDEQIDAKELAQEAYKSAASNSGRVRAMSRVVWGKYNAGVINYAKAQALLRSGFEALLLIEYAKIAGKVATLADSSQRKQEAALKSYGEPLDTIPAVRNIHIKERENERLGLTAPKGTEDGNG